MFEFPEYWQREELHGGPDLAACSGEDWEDKFVGGIKDVTQDHGEDLSLLFPFLLYVKIEFTYYTKMTKTFCDFL